MDGFPVRVYRKTEYNGWQAMRPRNSQRQIVTMKATPKQGYVVLHRIQVRVRLSTPVLSSTNETSSKKNKNLEMNPQSNTRSVDDCVNDKKTRESIVNDVLVIRRRHYILISSKTRSRSLVLQFKDLQSCLRFSDELVRLNPHQEIRMTTDPATGTSVDSNNNQNNSICLLDRNFTSHYESQRASATTHEGTDTQQVLSYVARLLYDERFANFCNILESNILATEDGREMFNTLVTQNNNDAYNNISNESHTSSDAFPSMKQHVDETVAML